MHRHSIGPLVDVGFSEEECQKIANKKAGLWDGCHHSPARSVDRNYFFRS